MDQFVFELRKIPSVTRTLCAVSLVITLGVMINAFPPYSFYYVRRIVTDKFEIHRVPLSFLFDRTNIYYFLDLFALYTHSNQLESGPFSLRSGDYAWQLLMACLAIIVVDTPFNAMSHMYPLTVCLAYVSSSAAPTGAQTSFMGIITLPVVYTPYIMIMMALAMGGPVPAGQALGGAIVGHLWWWAMFSGTNNRPSPFQGRFGAPQWLKNMMDPVRRDSAGNRMRDPAGATAGSSGGVTVIPPRQFAGTASTRGENTATASGYSWGSTGQKLGQR